MKSKTCRDCGTQLKGHGNPVRCRGCSARANYIKRFGRPAEMLSMACGTCGLEFVDYVSNRKQAKIGVNFCSAECRAAWVGVHNSVSRGGDAVPRTKSEKDAVYYRKNADDLRERQRLYYQRNRETILAAKQSADRALKAEVIEAYGGICACCSEAHHEFLTIDHINGDGAEHRRLLGKGRKIYADLKKRGFPKDGYRLLCLNCNIALGFYGYCPHRPHEKRAVNKRPRKPGRRRAVV